MGRKQDLVIQTLLNPENNLPQPDAIDKPASPTCRSRPDIVYRQESHITIVEIDEHGHKDRDQSKEFGRMYDIIEDQEFSQGKPITFIRYNPDNDDENALTVLIECLKVNITIDPIPYDRAIYLFYDKYICHEPIPLISRAVFRDIWLDIIAIFGKITIKSRVRKLTRTLVCDLLKTPEGFRAPVAAYAIAIEYTSKKDRKQDSGNYKRILDICCEVLKEEYQ